MAASLSQTSVWLCTPPSSSSLLARLGDSVSYTMLCFRATINDVIDIDLAILAGALESNLFLVRLLLFLLLLLLLLTNNELTVDNYLYKSRFYIDKGNPL